MVEEKKTCPYCGGEIQAAARKCRHCGEFLDESLRQAQAGPPPAQAGLPPSNTAATVSLIFGIIGILFGCLGIVAIICGIIGLSNAGKHPARPGHGAALAGLILGIIGLLIVPVMVAIAIPSLLESGRAASEASAIASLRTIASAEEQFKVRQGRYGKLEELGDANLIDRELAGATTMERAKMGYIFEVEVSDVDWSCSAVPAMPTIMGDRSFYVDQTGVVRYKKYTSATDPPADSSSTPLGE